MCPAPSREPCDFSCDEKSLLGKSRLSNGGLGPLSAICAQSSTIVHFCGLFGPLSKGNFRGKMTTIVGNRGQLWTSTLSPHLLSPHLDFPNASNCDYLCDFSRQKAFPLQFGLRRGCLRQEIAAIRDCEFWCSQDQTGIPFGPIQGFRTVLAVSFRCHPDKKIAVLMTCSESRS